ncbi:MAG: energy transducer TonB [Candidatus Marinimicrobia bacterium]|nr:energy transducer TonB [Candidatus Neomarinimicrobiota bacterium]
MIIRVNPEYSLKLRYNYLLRIGLVGSLLLTVFIFAAFPRFQETAAAIKKVDFVMETTDVPIIEQKIDQAAAPTRPAIPVESENEDFSEDITIDETTDLSEYQAWEAPPPPPEQKDDSDGPRIRFIPYEKAPEPLGGFAAIQANVIYPEIAQEAGIEGTVIVQAFVNEFGIVAETVVLKGVPNTGLDEAACAAIKKTRFKPAQQRDQNIGVYISIPVIFKIKSN